MKAGAKIRRILVLTALIVLALSSTVFAKTTTKKKTLSLSFGQVKTISAGSKSKWKTSKSSVIKVKAAKNGKKATITATGVGTAKVTATFTNKKTKIVWTITVKSAASSSGKGSDAESGSGTGSSSGSSSGASLSPNDTAGMSTQEAAAYKTMLKYRTTYPEGMSWTDYNRKYYWNGGITIGGTGCAAFSFELSDAIFGNAPAKGWRANSDRSNIYDMINMIQVGDILRVDNRVSPSAGSHQVIVLKRTSNSFIVAEGNYDGKVHWGREIKFSALAAKTGADALIYFLTRY